MAPRPKARPEHYREAQGKMMDVRNSMLRERKRLRLPRLSHDGMREGEGKRFLGWITEPKTAVHRQNR